LTKRLRGSGEMAPRDAFGPRAAVWRPLYLAASALVHAVRKLKWPVRGVG